MKQGLIVFAKEPAAGRVKTRLAAAVGNQVAADLYETMLLDVLELSGKLSGVETVVYWDCTEEALPRLGERFGCRSRRQVQGDLGARMQAAFAGMFASGHDLCCIIGSDAPDLPPPYVTEAYKLLAAKRADVVFGPSRDGGYYLLGLRQPRPGLFANISWSSAHVLEQSLAAADESGLTAALLPEWQDIDTVEDLQAYRERNRPAASTEPL